MKNKTAIAGTIVGAVILASSLIKSSIDDKLLNVPQTTHIKREHFHKNRDNKLLAYAGMFTILVSLQGYKTKKELEEIKLNNNTNYSPVNKYDI